MPTSLINWLRSSSEKYKGRLVLFFLDVKRRYEKKKFGDHKKVQLFGCSYKIQFYLGLECNLCIFPWYFEAGDDHFHVIVIFLISFES